VSGEKSSMQKERTTRTVRNSLQYVAGDTLYATYGDLEYIYRLLVLQISIFVKIYASSTNLNLSNHKNKRGEKY
jgi:hypothetical protein